MNRSPERVKFTDLVEILRPKAKVQKTGYLPDGLLPVVDQGAGLIGGYTNDTGARFPSTEPVIVFGDHTCRFKYVPFPFAAGADGTQVFRAKEGIDTHYLFFACQTLGLEHFGYQRHMKHLKVAEVPVWPLPTQQRIAAILSAYDDLIENNTRRIAILEEMTRRLYEEWFVQFRFPGHEAAEFDGELPEGWTRMPATSAFEIKYGKTLPKKELSPNGDFPVYGAGGVIGRFDKSNIDGPTTLITSRGAGSGHVWRAMEEGFVTNNSFTVRPNSVSAGWHHGLIELVMEHAPISGAVGGAAQPQLTHDGLSSVSVLLPPAPLAEQLSHLLQPMFAMICGLETMNGNLRAQRDLLLPKLISGEIDVSGAEKALEAAE